jgi:hypothetical protein
MCESFVLRILDILRVQKKLCLWIRIQSGSEIFGRFESGSETESDNLDVKICVPFKN